VRGLDVEGLDWADCQRWFASVWEPGQHVAICAPTGGGKTTVVVWLARLRKWVVALDPKGGDDTLRATGFPRLSSWPPPRKAYKAMAEGKPVRYIVGPVADTGEDLPRLQATCQQCLRGVFDDGGWTTIIDEYQILSDRRMMGLSTDVDKLLIAARRKGVSVVTLFQAPKNISHAAHEQARWIWVSLTYDDDVVARLASMVGRNRDQMRGLIEGLDSTPYSWLIIGKNPREPIIATVPKEV
jgi:hypothetical protein